MEDAPLVGEARFYRDGDVVMFHYVINARNEVGPRPMTARDRSEHAGAYRAFAAADLDAEVFNGADPAAFDHNQDGAPGGSKKGARRKKPAAK